MEEEQEQQLQRSYALEILLELILVGLIYRPELSSKPCA